MFVFVRCVADHSFVIPQTKLLDGKEVSYNMDIIPGTIYMVDDSNPLVKKSMEDKQLFFVGPADNSSPITEIAQSNPEIVEETTEVSIKKKKK